MFTGVRAIDKLVKLCSFGSFILWISLRSQTDLLYKSNCHVEKKSAVGTWSSLDSVLLATVVEVSISGL